MVTLILSPLKELTKEEREDLSAILRFERTCLENLPQDEFIVLKNVPEERAELIRQKLAESGLGQLMRPTSATSISEGGVRFTNLEEVLEPLTTKPDNQPEPER
jgi:hypothetical protein